jgi:hypothetical protein
MNGMPPATTIPALPRIVDVIITDDTLSADLEDGRTISVPLGWYPRLAYGTQAERSKFQISGGGFGIHWPDLDEDLGVEGLLLGKKSAESASSLARWLEQRKAKGVADGQ